MRRVRPLIFLAAIALLCTRPVGMFAQVGATLGGFVSDETGGALPGVTVTITNTSNGTTQALVTGADGNYRAVALSPAPTMSTGPSASGARIWIELAASQTSIPSSPTVR